MEHEHPSTTAAARAGGAKASSPAASSFPTAFQNDNKQWDVTDNSARPIPYGRFNGLLNTKIGGCSSPCRSRARVPSSASGILSSRLDGSRRPAAQSLPNQHLSQSLADRLEAHPYRLPSSHRPRWIDPNENGLTNAKASFASGANSDD